MQYQKAILELSQQWKTKAREQLDAVEEAVDANPNLTISSPEVTVRFKEAQILLKCALELDETVKTVRDRDTTENP